MSLKQEDSDDVVYEVSTCRVELTLTRSNVMLTKTNSGRFSHPKVDVVLNANRTGSLHLFQFPSGHSPLSSHKHLLGEVRSRPAQTKFEIDVQFDTNSTTFDKSKGKQIAQFVNGAYAAEEQENANAAAVNGAAPSLFPNDIMDRLVLNSEQMNNTTFYYALGYVRTDLSDVQLIPISSVCEFKKGFKHFDKVKIQTTGKKTTDEDLEEFNEPEEEPEDQGFKKVAMRFESRYENKKKTDANSKPENEPWKPLVYFDYGLSKFDKEKDMILYKHVDEDEPIAK
jgi:hypothetical protein